MTLFLDCEFNGFETHELISIALVSDEPGPAKEFYAVLPLPDRVAPWVTENVLPQLGKPSEHHILATARLLRFLRAHPGEHIIADFPLDHILLLSLLMVPGGRWHPIELSMRLIDGLPVKSRRPHNALSDARALMRAYHAAY